jgi:hypothetical protein
MKQDYTPGEECQCSAYNESECGCGADWTPKEIYELREQLDRLLDEREQWRLSSICRIIKRDLEKARIENDWLGERLNKMEIDKNKAELERNLWKAEAERWWKQLMEQERNRMRGL